MTEKTAEQLAAEKAAADAAKAQKQAEAKAAKEAKAAEAKAKKEAEQAEKKAKKEAEAKAKADEKAAKEAAKAEKLKAAADAKAAKEAEKAAKAKAKEDAKAAKEAKRMPEQNGVRRPGPDGACGKAWAVFDELSRSLGRPVPIADALTEAEKRGLNAGNVRTEYARWKKFNGIAGRVEKATPAAAGTEGQTSAAA